MVIKGGFLDDNYIILKKAYYDRSRFQAFIYKLIKYKNNKSEVRCIDQLTIKTVHDIIRISKTKFK